MSFWNVQIPENINNNIKKNMKGLHESIVLAFLPKNTIIQ